MVREGQLVLDTLAQATGAMRWDMQEFPWSCDYYLEHGQYMPDDALDILDGFDAILYGACGLPDVVPDEISQHQGVLRVRQGIRALRQPASGRASAARSADPAGGQGAGRLRPAVRAGELGRGIRGMRRARSPGLVVRGGAADHGVHP